MPVFEHPRGANECVENGVCRMVPSTPSRTVNGGGDGGKDNLLLAEHSESWSERAWISRRWQNSQTMPISTSPDVMRNPHQENWKKP